MAASSPIRRPQVAPTIRFSLATHASSPPVPPPPGRTLVGIRQSLLRARGKEALALPVAEKARAPFLQRSKTARISVSPQQFSGTARWTGGPLAVDEVPAKRQFSAVTFAALSSSLLSRLRRDARCLGFAKAFPAHGEGGPLAVDEVPAKRQFSAVTFAALSSSALSRLWRDARCKGFACIRFPLAGDGEI